MTLRSSTTQTLASQKSQQRRQQSSWPELQLRHFVSLELLLHTRMEPHHLRCRMECKPSLSVTSATVIAFGRSCLLANTSSTASLSSSCTSTTRCQL